MPAPIKTENSFIQSLLDQTAFPHPVGEIELLETHISWIILTGEYAYKLKKPIQFDFVDYSTLEKRRKFCKLEVKLNQRFAPDIYLGVVPIVKSDSGIKVSELSSCGESNSEQATVVEYAVKMRQFSQDAIVASRLENPQLNTTSIEDFGRSIAKFHASIESADPRKECIQPHHVTKDAIDNFATVKSQLKSGHRLETLNRLEQWTIEQAEILTTHFEYRLKHGFVRRCHGDLHLKNIIQVDGIVSAFDGIEFNEAFQWIDVLSEVAFPVMDFMARGRSDLGWRFLNAYLEQTGDYENLDVLRFYLVYRAMVRAKVTCLNPKNAVPESRSGYAKNEDPEPELGGPWDKYLKAANSFAFSLPPMLSITHGFSGSGKSTVAMKTIDEKGGLRIRSDVERNRLAPRLPKAEKYSDSRRDQIYSRLLELARVILDSGFSVIVDATFLSHKRRTPFIELAGERKIQFSIIDCQADFDELCERIRNRGADPSEATIKVLKQQMESHDPLTELEQTFVSTHHDSD